VIRIEKIVIEVGARDALDDVVSARSWNRVHFTCPE
jgi:hypothetical protein